ncbi:MAG TPA: adenylate/guanylate cyclase domain-containing protein [Gammaproteobacteria bacterium]|nr:adenylate/guanylate cyclase domain-containing protein [Gammaproteobacteria bacterium]
MKGKFRLSARGIVLFAFVLLIIINFFAMHALQPIEYWLQDALVRVHAAGKTPDPNVVVVNVDERSLYEMTKQVGGWPWPRAVYGQLLEGILAEQPAAVVFDINFVDPDLVRPDSDKYFIDVATASNKVFFPMVRLEGADDSKNAPIKDYPAKFGFMPGPGADPEARVALQFPLPPLAMTGRVGVINFLQDFDGIGRRYYLHYDAYGWQIPSLPARVAEALGWTMPDQSSLLLNWRGTAETAPQLSFYDVYADFQRHNHQRPADEFTHKIVIIGSNATSLGDLRATPISHLYPGAFIVATAIANLKNGDWMRRPSDFVGPLLALILVLGVAAFFRWGRGLLFTGVLLLLITPVLIAIAYGLLNQRWLVPVFQPLIMAWLFFISMGLADYFRERRDRLYAIGLFSRFLDPRVVNDLVKSQRNLLDDKATSCELTVLFSDIRGFTPLSETRTPEEVVSLLNRYFSLQVAVIFRHGGTVDKFIGDCIMAFWGAPVPDPEQAKHAVQAGLEMAKVLEVFRRDLGELSESFDIGIGIHTGSAVVGFMGSENKLDYTAIGDTVNLASRIESQTKGVARILVSAATRERCGQAFDFNDRGSYKVKGREQVVHLFEPVEKKP